jgi:hypothetical protein
MHRSFVLLASPAALTLAVSSAAAERTCAVRIVGETAAGGRWIQAISEVNRHLARDWVETDCAAIELTFSGQAASLEYITTRGAAATRTIASPLDLAPTVQALLVTDDVAEAPEQRPVVHPSSAMPITERPEAPVRLSSDTAVGMLVSGSAGARGGGSAAAVTPLVRALLAIQLNRRWELGVTGQWETGYRTLAKPAEPEWRGRAISAGVLVGRREPIGPSLELLGGATLSAAAVHQESIDEQPEQERHELADARLGAYLGLAGPSSSKTRWRVGLDADIAPARVGGNAAAAGTMPDLPFWSLALSAGIEMEVR